ncbi:MAG: lipid-binding SYLF domain-containing protein [Planktomarina sp.]
MTQFTRRGFGAALGSTALLGACGTLQQNQNAPQRTGAQKIDARVDVAINQMLQEFPDTRILMNNAEAMLVMPLVTEAGIGFGGGYGRGALRRGGRTVDYYSAASLSTGLQFGAQQFSHTIFFMTQDALQQFQSVDGWEAGANLEFAIYNAGKSVEADTMAAFAPVIGVIFAQAGLRIGATLEGTKYSRITP